VSPETGSSGRTAARVAMRPVCGAAATAV
jgi:hypothetical protein